MRITLIRVTIILALTLGFTLPCLAENASPSQFPKLAFLSPQFVHDESPIGERGKRGQEGVSMVNPDESMLRISERIGKELKWPITVISYKESQNAQNIVSGYSATKPGKVRFRQLQLIADKLGTKYLVAITIRELNGMLSGKGGFSARRTGRANIDVMVYDRSEDNFVWQANVIDTSSKSTLFRSSAIAPRIDQALFNALSKALDPFVLNGKRMVIPKPSIGLVTNVKSVTPDGKTVLLDLDSGSDIQVGDEFLSLDGTKRIKITEVLQNASIAVTVSGSPSTGDVFKSAE